MATTTSTMSTTGKYPAKSHCQRVAAELNMPKGMILLKGAKTKFYPDSDQPVPFRQNRYFYYMTGCNEPGCWMTYEVEKSKLTLWMPKPVQGRSIFYDGKGLTREQAMERYDVDAVKHIKAPKADQPKKTNIRKLLVDHHKAEGTFAFFKAPKALVGKPLQKKLKEKRTVGLRPAIHKCRAVKDEYEIAQIRKANAISAEAHADVMKQLHMLKSEHEVEALYRSTCLAHRAKQQAYEPVCGAGANAGQLHYVKNDQDFDATAQVLLVDAGAEWEQYATDITRTMPLNAEKPGSWPSEEAAAVYDAVAKIQEECIKELAPGTKFIDVAWKAVHMAIDKLLEMGVLKGDHMEIFHAGTVLAFFPHGLGHHVGLEVHDVGPPPVGGWKAIVKDMAKRAPKKAGKKVEGEKSDDEKAAQGPKAGGKKAAGPKAAGKKPNGPNAAGKKPSWGGPKRAGPKAGGLKKAMQEKIIFDVKDEEKLALLEQDPLAEESSDPKDNKKGKKAGPGKGKNGKGKGKGMKNGKGKGKKPAGPRRIIKDRRFARTQGAYNAFATSAGMHASLRKGLMPMHYSLNPRTCKSPNTPTAPALEAGNVLTIEPGLYFHRFVLEKMYLTKKKHAAFIDTEVLEKFMGVGGVRVEDTVLITEKGNEVLSAAAPKGDAMLETIKEGWSY